MTSDTKTGTDGTLLTGLDGSNPLAFLAALGLLRTLKMGNTKDATLMAWNCSSGRWCPTLNMRVSEEVLVKNLADALDASPPAPWSLHKKLPFEATILRKAILLARQEASAGRRETLDMLGALGSEAVADDAGIFADTALRMVRAGDSAGQGLLAYGKRIRDETTCENLHEALFQTWTHRDEHSALRWDPIESRNYALRWKDPSKEKTGSVRGAARLALESLPLLPALPVGKHVDTTGFTRHARGPQSFTWPIWSVFASLDVTRSLVALSELQLEKPNGSQLKEYGIATVYRSDRIMTTKYYSNFTPARRLT